MKKEEFDLNFGGWSRYACPNCKTKRRLIIHLSHKNVKKKTRYFCEYGHKFELRADEGSYLELFRGEFKSTKPFSNTKAPEVID